MAFRTTIDIDSDKLAGEITRIDEISDRVRLANLALAAPLLDMRLAQMGREIQRVARKKGADHPDVAARQSALDRATTRFGLANEELSRARLDMPVLKGDTTAGVWGRVANNGAPVGGVTVIVFANGKRVDFRCTDANGGYAMEVPSNTPLVLSAWSAEGAEVYRDGDAQTLAAGQQLYREIDLGRGASKPCPEPPSDEAPPSDGTFPMVNLVGQTEADARAILRTQGLILDKRAEETSEDKIGLILGQDPKPDTRIKRGGTVSIVVGVSGKVTVPLLIGLNQAEAEKTLKEANLAEGNVTFITVTKEKAGLVTNQNPAAGTRADPGDKVALEIGSEGETPPQDAPFAMPDLVGQTEAAATTMLRNQNLTLAKRGEVVNEDRVGLVIAQEPQAKTPVKPGASVAIVVGISAKVRVPSLFGMSQADAEKTLSAANFASGGVTFVTATRDRAGLVRNQNPAPHAMADPGTKIALEIGQEAQPRVTSQRATLAVARLAEERMRAANVGTDLPEGFVADALAKNGAIDAEGIDKFLTQQRQAIRDQLGLRTLADTDRAIALLKLARTEVIG